MRLKKGWYILNYHDISWEESSYLVGIGGSFPPDIFREHLNILSSYAKLVSIDEGFNRLRDGNIDEPLVSFWFDDGFRGVKRYAFEIMQEFNITGALSINSKFTKKEELFWRMKLSYLSQNDGLKSLRDRFKPLGYKISDSIKAWSMDNFSIDIINIIDEVYKQYSRDIDREDAFRYFETIEGIEQLYSNGWEIANHSASHYPISEASYIDNFLDEFLVCAKFLEDIIGSDSRFWVLPFDRDSVDMKRVFNILQSNNIDRVIVRVQDRVNLKYENILYRIEPPYLRGREFIKYISSVT